jgi:hypothetical protein
MSSTYSRPVVQTITCRGTKLLTLAMDWHVLYNFENALELVEVVRFLLFKQYSST